VNIMVKKIMRKRGIPALLLLGVIVMIIFYYLYGGMMLLRHILGALIFATFTVSMIKVLNGKLGKKNIRV